MSDSNLLSLLSAAAAGYLIFRLWLRLRLSFAKHPSLRGHSRMAQRLSRWVPFYAYGEADFYRSDDAPEEVATRRKNGLLRLGRSLRERAPRTLALTKQVEGHISDLQFTSLYRVPFQYRELVQEELEVGAFVSESSGVTVRDLDGNTSIDLTGSYGVNVMGYDFYKECLQEAHEEAHALGPVLGAYHPAIADNVKRLSELSGLDEISFHMSGTEAVMQAVRLARYHTRRTHLVRFCGAYHGWWGDVQPGVGNPLPARETYTLTDLSPKSLAVLRTRRDIACVLVNPLQALHPNGNAPSDSALVDSGRSAAVDRERYAAFLTELRAVCTERGIVLILDEVFTGFRLARGGAQEYFGVKADLVVYGKTLGGGLPVGVVCGRRELMKRFREAKPTDICFARGTFNSHPYVMTAMRAFLRRLDSERVLAMYGSLDATWEARARLLNERLNAEDLPVSVVALSSIWTVCYGVPSRYNWMLQYYLRAEGLALSWVGTGRLIFSLDFDDAAFAEVVERFLSAARKMRDDGFWWTCSSLTNKAIKRRVLKEMLKHRLSASRSL
jgi:glutamate-1-semialdehyde 2,1-aminomutase